MDQLVVLLERMEPDWFCKTLSLAETSGQKQKKGDD